MTDELTSKRDTTEETQSEKYREVKAELEQKRTDLDNTKQQREELKSQLDDINNQIINARGE
jgi:predicted  nucleic acid-binding Zn-ribbon protein